MSIDELFVGGRDKSRMRLHWDKNLISWRNFFLVLDRMTHWFETVRIRPLRSIALKQAEKWMLERFEMSDGFGESSLDHKFGRGHALSGIFGG